jgi:DNA-binding transcriptional LysR family regulator
MDLKSVDLNLLVVLHAMLEHRSVTRAAAAVGLSQPAMSAAVSRLRRLFADPLFVRSGAEMKPTSRALELSAPVRQVIETVRTGILQRSHFEPSVTQRRFVLLTPDLGEIHFVPAMLRQLAKLAPHARLSTWARAPKAAAEALESGAADLALGYFPDLHKHGFVQQKLFDNMAVCLVRRGHPCSGVRIALDEYLAAGHAVVKPDGRDHVFDEFLERRGLQRRVALELSHFFSLLPVIESSDLIATVPRDIAEVCVRYGDVRIVDPPLRSPSIPIHQTWHERVHHDPANVAARRGPRAFRQTDTRRQGTQHDAAQSVECANALVSQRAGSRTRQTFCHRS